VAIKVMELKDVILSTLAEMEHSTPQTNKVEKVQEIKKKEEKTYNIKTIVDDVQEPQQNELIFLNSMRERLLVLFEGFQAPNNKNIEAKIDMTLNYLEYMLATIDSRLEEIKKGKN
jgi:hypothetical protein